MSKRKSRTARLALRFRPGTSVPELRPELAEEIEERARKRRTAWQQRAENFVRHTLAEVEAAMPAVVEWAQALKREQEVPQVGPRGKPLPGRPVAGVRKDRQALIRRCTTLVGNIRQVRKAVDDLQASGRIVDARVTRRVAALERQLSKEIERQQAALLYRLAGRRSVARRGK